LSEDQQDAIVGDMADGKATGFPTDLSGKSFFLNLRRHTAEGMFSDPVYGGDRDLSAGSWLGIRARRGATTRVNSRSREPRGNRKASSA